LNSLSVWAWAALAHRIALRASPAFTLPRILDLDRTHEASIADAVALARVVSQSVDLPPDGPQPTPSWRAYLASEVALSLETALAQDHPMRAQVRACITAACCASRAAEIHVHAYSRGCPEVLDHFSLVVWGMVDDFEREAVASARSDLRWLMEHGPASGPILDAFFDRPLWVAGQPTNLDARLEARRVSLHGFVVPRSYLGPRSVDSARRVRTSDIRKGARVKLRSEQEGEVLDNRTRQYTRTVRLDVRGREHDEVGDVHVGDLEFVDDAGVWIPVDLTPKQAEAKRWLDMTMGRTT
jgi:hypothetical protein